MVSYVFEFLPAHPTLSYMQASSGWRSSSFILKALPKQMTPGSMSGNYAYMIYIYIYIFIIPAKGPNGQF